MKHTFATMLLTALFCAVAAQGMAEDSRPSVYTKDIHGGTVKFYGADPTSNPTTPEITQAAPGTTVYLVPEPDAFHTTEGMQLQAVKAAHSDVAESRAGTPGYAEEIVLEQVGQTLVYRFTMTAGGADVMVTATFPKRTQKVKYLDPTKPAGHQECEVEAYILDKPVSKLPGSGEGEWYVCTTPAADNGGKGLVIDGTLTIQNNVNLILADGCKMTVSAGIGLHKGYFVYVDGYLSIYAQTTGDAMGQLVATSNSDYGIHLSTLAINGGAITASGPERGILCVRSGNNTVLSINGGRVSAEGTGTGSYGIESHDKMSITGGQVTAAGTASGIKGEAGGLDIALSSADDFVVASGYYFRDSPEAHELHLGAVGNDGSGCYLASTPGLSVPTPFAYVAGGITLSADQQAAIAGKRIALTTEVVTYKDASGTLQNIATDTYIDGNGEEKPYTENDITYVLTGTEQEIGTDGKTRWYVSTGELNFTDDISIHGNLHLILADDCKMSVMGPQVNGAISGSTVSSFTIYGQSVGSGQLIAKGNYNGFNINGAFTLNGGQITIEADECFSSGADVTINGGVLNALGRGKGIACQNFILNDGKVSSTGYNAFIIESDFTINGGVLYANGSNYGIYCSNNFTFNGGKVTAIGGSEDVIYCSNGDIVLGFTSPDDYIYASNYNCVSGSVKTAAGKRFVAYRTENSPGDEGFDPALTKTEAWAIIGDAASTEATALSSGISLTNPDITPTIAGKTLRPLVITEPDGQGGTTVSAACLLGIVPGDIAPADKTAHDFTLGSTPYYIYKAVSEGTTIPLSVPAYGQQGADFTVSIDGAAESVLTDPAVTIASGKATAALPWTGANDVEIRDARYYNTGVKYLEWSDKKDKLVQLTTSTDADNLTKVYILPGGAGTALRGGWYVVNNHNTDDSNNGGIDAQYAGGLHFDGDTHIIIADGAKMQVGTAESPIDDEGIEVLPGSLAIHAQTEGASAGTLNIYTGINKIGIDVSSNTNDASVTLNGVNATCYANKANGIFVRSSGGNTSVTINGGIVDLAENREFNGDGPFEPTDNSPWYAICAISLASSSVTIRDACVSLYGSDGSIRLYSPASYGSTSNLTIQGGQIHDYSTAGIELSSADGYSHVTLGWKNISDYIYIPKYTVEGDVRIASEQYLMACDAVGGSGKAFGGTLTAADIAAIQGKYLQPAIYSVSAPDRVILAVTDGANAVEPFTIGDGDAATPYYIYKEGLTVSASLKNEDMQADFTFKNAKGEVVPGTFTYRNTQGATATVTFDDSSTDASIAGANAVRFTMPDDDVVIDAGNVGVPAGDKLYLAFVDNSANVTTSDADVVILVYQGLQMNAATGAIEALFKTVGEVPKDLPVIFANKTDGSNLPATIPVAQDNSDAANTLAETIRSAASPFFMTGTTGNWLADILIAALTGADGNPLTNSSGIALSQEVSDYVFFVFTVDRFVPVSATAASQLSGRRFILAIDKLTLLKFLNGTGTPAATRAAAPADAATPASARAGSPADAATTAASRAGDPSGSVRTFPLVIGNDATAIMGPSLAPELYGAGSSEAAGSTGSAASWYSIDGRRLDSRPRSKGIYIINGKKSVIR